MNTEFNTRDVHTSFKFNECAMFLIPFLVEKGFEMGAKGIEISYEIYGNV